MISFWQYFHNHLQDNLLASFVAFCIGYVLGIRKHFKEIRKHLHAQDATVALMHKHIKEIRDGRK